MTTEIMGTKMMEGMEASVLVDSLMIPIETLKHSNEGYRVQREGGKGVKRAF
jgi:hypothetical protein